MNFKMFCRFTSNGENGIKLITERKVNNKSILFWNKFKSSTFERLTGIWWQQKTSQLMLNNIKSKGIR